MNSENEPDLGDPFDSSCFAIVPNDQSLVAPLAAFVLSGGLREELAKLIRLGS